MTGLILLCSLIIRPMTETQINDAFTSWWQASFPNTTPSSQTRMTHSAFGRYLLEQVQGQQQQREVER